MFLLLNMIDGMPSSIRKLFLEIKKSLIPRTFTEELD